MCRKREGNAPDRQFSSATSEQYRRLQGRHWYFYVAAYSPGLLRTIKFRLQGLTLAMLTLRFLLFYMYFLLIIAGDFHLNPGPNKIVRDKNISFCTINCCRTKTFAYINCPNGWLSN
jgi:hypothetical protein